MDRKLFRKVKYLPDNAIQPRGFNYLEDGQCRKSAQIPYWDGFNTVDAVCSASICATTSAALSQLAIQLKLIAALGAL